MNKRERAHLVRDQKRETRMEMAGEVHGVLSAGILCGGGVWLAVCVHVRTYILACLRFPQQRADLTERCDLYILYDLTDPLITVIHPLISGTKANTDPHTYSIFTFCSSGA